MGGDFLQILGCAYALHHTDHRGICSKYLNNCSWCQPSLWELQVACESRVQCGEFNGMTVVPPEIGKASTCAPSVKEASLSPAKCESHWSEFTLCGAALAETCKHLVHVLGSDPG